MRIEITGEKLADVYLDLNIFRTTLCNTWNLSLAVRKSIIAISGGIPRKNIIESLTYIFDWMSIIRNLHFKNFPSIQFKYYPVRVEGLMEYTPGKCSLKVYEIDEKRIDKDDVIIVNSFTPSVDFMLRSFIMPTIYNYGEEKWQV